MNRLTATRPMTDEEIEVMLGVFAEVSKRRQLSLLEQEVRRSVFAEHCQIMATQVRSERLANERAAA